MAINQQELDSILKEFDEGKGRVYGRTINWKTGENTVVHGGSDQSVGEEIDDPQFAKDLEVEIENPNLDAKNEEDNY